uniref:exodeoxyribonuclease III n=1 Tax=Oryzias latipes TaxID=8090 RepID=A0A3P9HAV9_ORYLA
MSNTKILTLNVKGINHVIKRRKTLTLLKKEKVQIALLQETHLTDHEHSKLKHDWVGQIFYSSYNSKSRGVAILIHKNVPFTVEKIVKDKEGRYIAITGILYGEQILLGNVYAPNVSNVYDSAFYSKFLAEVSPICPSHVLIGGDFNTGLIPSSDYSPPKTQPLSKMAKATNGLCNDLGLFDAWRICNPNVRDFTFFSRPHQSFSRIDFLFVSRSVLDKTHLCSINPCVLSDHSSVFIELLPPYYDPLSRQWRLNPSLLSDPVFIKYLEEHWELYITTNDTPEVSASVLWEAGKAFLRGSIISFTAAIRKNILTKQLDLEHQICTLDRDFKQSSSPSVLKKLDAARSALDQLLTQKAETTMFYAKHRLFESGNKPGHRLC